MKAGCPFGVLLKNIDPCQNLAFAVLCDYVFLLITLVDGLVALALAGKVVVRLQKTGYG